MDRVRFNGLDIFMLRTAYAKKLPLIAGCLLHENMQEMLVLIKKPLTVSVVSWSGMQRRIITKSPP